LSEANSTAPTDLISEGDVLSVAIFETGGTPLFGRQASSTAATPVVPGAATNLAASGSSQDTFPHVVVDRSGAITLPFAGVVHVVGLTPDAAAAAVRAALRGQTANPQVAVSVISSTENTVSVLGEVRTPGRFPISSHNDRILDLIASAGGPTKPAPDVKVVIVRGETMIAAPLSQLFDDPAQNIRLAPHDQIRLISRDRKFSTFGAFGRVTENPMLDEHLTLAAAISRNGGLDTYSADNSAVFVFRFERPEVARALGVVTPPTPKGVPIIYRLNMKEPSSYFTAENFEIEPADMVYVPRASSIAVKKFLDLVNVVTSVAYTAAVTGTQVQ
jgi:polysaccharide export outer membrane protein